MSSPLSPPSWTEWTRNPSERSPQRQTFEEILDDLRRDGLVAARSSLFVHLARYSYLIAKNARIVVLSFFQSIPDQIFRDVPINSRSKELETLLKILVSAGLAAIEEDSPSGIVSFILTERATPDDVARTQNLRAVSAYLKEVFGRWDPSALVATSSSFPTEKTAAKATGVDFFRLTSGPGISVVQDRPESNDTNPSPFLQETITKTDSLALLQFWPLPEPKDKEEIAENSTAVDPEFSLLIPSDLALTALVKSYCVPVFDEFFRSGNYQDAASEIQRKYASYMLKYRERFPSAAGTAQDLRIDRVLSSSDPEGQAFANGVYVLVQVLKGLGRMPPPRGISNPVVYQAARIAYAYTMALRVKKRKEEKESAVRNKDSSLLLAILKESGKALTMDELRKSLESSKTGEFGSKFVSIAELLPLAAPNEGLRPLVYEVAGAFLHRENLVRVFVEVRERESQAQQERLARIWARDGIPPAETISLSEGEVSAEFFKIFQLVHQERALSTNLQEFLKNFISGQRNLLSMAKLMWPDGRKGPFTPQELVVHGLDPLLYEDKDRLRRRALVSVLGLAAAYPSIVKSTWNIVLLEEGAFRFVLRKLASLFGARSGSSNKEPSVQKKEAVSSKKTESGKKGVAGSEGAAVFKAQKATDLKRLQEMAPILKDRVSLTNEREKAANQWCLKFDPEAKRRTRQAVDAEVGRLVIKISLDQLSEGNGPRVALFLIERSSILGKVTSSRAFHRYLYLTALLSRAETLLR